MQQKNLALFIALFLLIIIGWPIVMNRFMKPRPKEGGQTGAQMPPPNVRRDLLQLSAVPSPALPGVTNALAAIGTDIGTRLALLPPPPPLSPTQRVSLTLLGSALAGSAQCLNSSALYEYCELAPRAVVQGKRAEVYRLGGGADDYLTLVLTTRGAGVQELVLNKFEAATREGLPAGHELQLIQDDPVLASFLMYHYPDVDKDDSRPVDTLGRETWVYQGGDSRQRVFSTTLPATKSRGELVITKTYRLEPRTYHITVTLEFELKGRPETKASPAKFRYQLVGAHGMPIEGEWYTSTYRNPMIATMDARNDVWRDLDDTQSRISVRKGGDKWPATGSSENVFVRYAGVANQFFAVVIVPEDKQVVDYVRPTLESEELRGKVLKVDPDRLLLLPRMESWDQRGTIKSLTLAGEKSELVLAAAGKDDKTYTFHLLPRVKELVEKERLGVGSDVVVSYDPHDNERLATSIRRWGVPFVFRLLPRTQELLAKEKEQFEDGTQVVVSYERSHDDQLVVTDLRKGESFRPYTEDITVRVVSKTLELKPGEKVAHKYLVYNGPVKVSLLGQFTGDKAVDPTLVVRYADDLQLRTMTDYRSAGPFGSFAQFIRWTDVLIWCTNRMHWLLNWLHWVVRDFGLTIIVLTFMVRGAMFPISRKQAYLSIKMQELAPEMKRLQEKHKNDPQARNQAVMELYRRHKVNPMGGCLPLILQMPIFLGLYYALQESIHFRLAPFLWIENLAAPDMLLRWGASIPFISNPDSHGQIYYLGPYFNLLPVVAVCFMVMQQKMLTPPPQDEQQAFQQKLMKYMMIFFGVMFYKVAAGLCLYFIVSSLWGLAERKLLPKRPSLALAGAGGVPPPTKNEARKPVSNGPAAAGRGRGRTGRKEKTAEVESPMQKVKDWWAEVLKQARKK